MHPVVAFYIFNDSSENVVQVAKTEIVYNAARFDPLTDALLAGSGMHPVIAFYIFNESAENVV